MKKLLALIVVLAISAPAVFSQNEFQQLKDDGISQTELRTAISLTEKLLLGQKNNTIYILTEDEAIPQVVKGLSKEVQIASYESIRAMFGDYESIKFAEAWTLTSAQGEYTIYRFKGMFTESDSQPEIRVTFDREGKLSGFWIRPWEDDLQGNP